MTPIRAISKAAPKGNSGTALMVTEPSVVVCSILLANRLLVKSYPTSFVSVRFRPVVPEVPSTVKVIVAKVPLPDAPAVSPVRVHVIQYRPWVAL